eukprot:6205515-Pleurochrysis_carterae.AAC.2
MGLRRRGSRWGGPSGSERDNKGARGWEVLLARARLSVGPGGARRVSKMEKGEEGFKDEAKGECTRGGARTRVLVVVGLLGACLEARRRRGGDVAQAVVRAVRLEPAPRPCEEAAAAAAAHTAAHTAALTALA